VVLALRGESKRNALKWQWRRSMAALSSKLHLAVVTLSRSEGSVALGLTALLCKLHPAGVTLSRSEGSVELGLTALLCKLHLAGVTLSRSEGSVALGLEMLRCAQHDKKRPSHATTCHLCSSAQPRSPSGILDLCLRLMPIGRPQEQSIHHC